MKFRQLQPNILDILGDEMGRTRSSGSFNTKMIYDQFSNIPANAIKVAIDSLIAQGFKDKRVQTDKHTKRKRRLGQGGIIYS